MGGYGSGRWGSHVRRRTVEECYHLDASKWQRQGILRSNGHWGGVVRYGAGDTLHELEWEVRTSESGGAMGVEAYGPDEAGRLYTINLVAQPRHFGALQWYFGCPNTHCGRMVRKLYRPPARPYFACRQCYRLSYRSSNESHVYDKWLDLVIAEMGIPGFTRSDAKRLLKEVYG